MSDPSNLPAAASEGAETGGRLAASDGRTLPLEATRMRVRAHAGLAVVVLEQRFRNPYDEPLHVHYLVPLPSDGVVAGYAFTLGTRRIVGEIDRVAAARERFERALVEGRTAALLEQRRSSLFEQEIGNVPPRAEVVAEITIDQPLAFLDEGAWEFRFPTVVAPRYQGAPSRVPDAAATRVDVAEGGIAARAELEFEIADETTGPATSPSHGLVLRHGTIRFADGAGAKLDRDVVVRWPVSAMTPRIEVACARASAGVPSGSAHALLSIVPPAPEHRLRPVARDLVVLLDTSGSMSGEPLAQAKRVVSALVASLSEHDSLEMVEFSSAPRRWQTDAVKMTAQNARAAQSWLAGLRASGGTEMRAGIFEAMRTLRVDAQRQILLVTDGLIGFESEIVAAVRRELPQSCRVHALGIGHGVNRSLTGPAARAGGGVEVIVAPGEDVEPVVARLLARTCSPQLVDLEISGTAVRGHAPVRIPDLFAGCPTRIALELDPAGGSLVVRGRRAGGGHHVQELVVPATDAGHGNAAIVRAWARERVEDLETALASGEVKGVIDAEIERIGLGFAISTRLTAWVAVSDQIDVDPTSPTRRERMPHELAAGMSIEGLGLRGAREEQTRFSMAVMAAPQGAAYAGAVPGAGPASMAPPSPARPKTKAAAGPLGMLRRFLPGRGRVTDDETPDLGERAAAAEEETVDELELAAEKFEVRGRIVLAEDGRVIVEVDAGEGFAWQPGTRVTLELADGRRIEVEIDPTSTSRASSLARGTTARLAVRTSEPANTIVAIELADAANTRIRIE